MKTDSDYKGESAAIQRALQQLLRARWKVKAAGFMGAAGGIFALVFVLGQALQTGTMVVHLATVALLSGGAVALAVGVGLVSCAEGARSAGSSWCLAWGLLNVIAGYTAARHGLALTGIFSLLLGSLMLTMAAVISEPAAVFLCGYLYGDIAPERLLTAAAIGRAEGNNELKKWLAPLQTPDNTSPRPRQQLNRLVSSSPRLSPAPPPLPHATSQCTLPRFRSLPPLPDPFRHLSWLGLALSGLIAS